MPKNLSEKQKILIKRAKELSGKGKVKNPSSGLEEIRNLRK